MPSSSPRHLVKAAAEVIAAEGLPESSKTANGDRLTKRAGSEAAIAERVGVPRQTSNDAGRHITAIDAYPELPPYPPVDALKIAATLDAMPEPERVEARAGGASALDHGEEAAGKLARLALGQEGAAGQEDIDAALAVARRSDLRLARPPLLLARRLGRLAALPRRRPPRRQRHQ